MNHPSPATAAAESITRLTRALRAERIAHRQDVARLVAEIERLKAQLRTAGTTPGPRPANQNRKK